MGEEEKNREYRKKELVLCQRKSAMGLSLPCRGAGFPTVSDCVLALDERSMLEGWGASRPGQFPSTPLWIAVVWAQCKQHLCVEQPIDEHDSSVAKNGVFVVE